MMFQGTVGTSAGRLDDQTIPFDLETEWGKKVRHSESISRLVQDHP
jgi:hypothetical protein